MTTARQGRARPAWRPPRRPRGPSRCSRKGGRSVASELAQEMVDAAVAKARYIGVSENVALLDDGGNLKAFAQMDGAPILCIEMAQNGGERNMKEKQVRIPGPDHPISIQRNPARVVVSVAGRVVADTRNALTLREAAYPPVQYIPSEDVDFSQLERTDHATYCPYKGDCNYYSVPAGGKKSVNAVWSYEDPF